MNPSCGKRNCSFNLYPSFDGRIYLKSFIANDLRDFDSLARFSLYEGGLNTATKGNSITTTAFEIEMPRNINVPRFIHIESAVGRIANDAKMLQGISTHATTVKNSGQKILEKTDKVREDLEKQIERLEEHIGRLKTDVAPDPVPN